MPQVKKPDDLQVFADHPVFVFMMIAFHDGNNLKEFERQMWGFVKWC